MSKRLSLEETLYQLKNWRESGDKEALTLLVLSNQGLVFLFANKYCNNVIPREDLQSICNEALIRAIHQFDYVNRPIEGFSSYIATAIEREISTQFKINNRHSHVMSFNQPIYEDKDGNSIKLEDTIDSGSEKELENKNNQYVVQELLTNLTSKERQAIILRYGLDGNGEKTLEEVGQILGYTRQGIYFLEKKALVKMKKAISITNPLFYKK